MKLRFAVVVNVVLFVVLLSIVLWYAEKDYWVLEVYNEPVAVSEERYSNWIPNYFDIHYCKKKALTALVTQYLVHESKTWTHYEINIGSKISSYPQSMKWCSESKPDIGRFSIYDSHIVVESWEYRIKIQVQYKPNPLRIVTVEFQSKVFTINR